MRFFKPALLCWMALIGLVQGGLTAETTLPVNTVRLSFTASSGDPSTGEAQVEAKALTVYGERPLDFNTFVIASTEATNQRPLSDCKIKRGSALQLYVERDDQERLKTYLVDLKGKKRPYTSGDFLMALAKSVEHCKEGKSAQLIRGRPTVQVYYEQSPTGLMPMLMHADGRIDRLTLGNLVTAIAELVPNCTYDSNQAIYVDFEKRSDGHWGAYVVDGHGTRAPISTDNLISAASETLQKCEPNSEPSPSTPSELAIPIRFGKDAQGHLILMVTNPKTNQSQPLNLDSLMTIAIALVPACDLPTPQTESIDVVFERNGRPYVVDRKGSRQSFNLFGDLIEASADFCLRAHKL